ncbi:MAG TPA: hypothetical protein VFW11_04340 [Cyclobacteriaceae bacterium]|nr:hypothetical protein [Cyclobacteriaceae bacterium]
MKANKIPAKVLDYVSEHFRDDFLFEVKASKKVHGRNVYSIEVSKDNYIYTLLFNEQGDMIKSEVVQAFPPDIHDEPTL